MLADGHVVGCDQTVALIPLVAAVAAERGLRLAALGEAHWIEAAA